MSINKKKLTTVYKRAQAKARRLHWQPADKTGLVPVARILKKNGSLQSFTRPKENGDPLSEKRPLSQVCTGYPFHTTSRRKSSAGFTISFQFYAPKAHSHFIVKAFYYKSIDTFMLKFFNKSNRSLNKYAIRTNRGDVRAILRTNFDILVYLATQCPHASFGFIGERNYFTKRSSHTTLLEPMADNQRFRIYRLFLCRPARYQWLIRRFELKYINALSTCLLINKAGLDPEAVQNKEKRSVEFFIKTFPSLNFSDL